MTMFVGQNYAPGGLFMDFTRENFKYLKSWNNGTYSKAKVCSKIF